MARKHRTSEAVVADLATARRPHAVDDDDIPDSLESSGLTDDIPSTSAGVTALGAPLNLHERAVIAALREVAFGEIEVVIHNARIVQITRSQKFRFNDR